MHIKTASPNTDPITIATILPALLIESNEESVSEGHIIEKEHIDDDMMYLYLIEDEVESI
jgi:hypothetical protein